MATFRSAALVPQRQHNEDRMRRAESWRQRSEDAASETDRFIFLWIAFNAAYGFEMPASDADGRSGEQYKFNRYCREIVNRDERKALHRILWHTYSGPIRILLDNPYVYEPFWKSVQGMAQAKPWNKQLNAENKRAFRSLANGDTAGVLRVVLSRLYTLRNQIFHGGATYATGLGQAQVRDGSRIMESVVPAILEIMRREIAANPDSEVWGRVSYPRVAEVRA